MKLQGSMEYLVVFAAILVVSLIVVFLLGSFGGFGEQSLIDQSKLYWRSQKPIALLDWRFIRWDKEMFVLKNNFAVPIEVVSINTSEVDYPVNVVLKPGQEYAYSRLSFGNFEQCNDNSEIGQLVEISATIYYRIEGEGELFAQTGTVPLREFCVEDV